MTWQDLSDGELKARLENRGVHPDGAGFLVEHREDVDTADFINVVLRLGDDD